MNKPDKKEKEMTKLPLEMFNVNENSEKDFKKIFEETMDDSTVL